jgi:large subunit ribosomal protein L30
MADIKMAQLRITQVKSTIDRPEKTKRSIKALGLSKLNDTVVHEDTPQILGILRKVNHLVKIEKI